MVNKVYPETSSTTLAHEKANSQTSAVETRVKIETEIPAENGKKQTTKTEHINRQINVETAATKGHLQKTKDHEWAWVILAASFIVQLIIFGLLLCFGIYFVTLLDYFQCTKGEVTIVGALAYGTKCLTGLLSSILYRRFGCRLVVMCGGIISAVGCFLSYFATRLLHLYFTFGIINGFGLGLAFTPSLGILPDYFDNFRYFATAFATVGGAIGTLSFQPIFLFLINTFGWQGSMIINAGISLQIAVCGMVLKSKTTDKNLGFANLIEKALFKDLKFWLFLLDSVLWGGTIYIVFSLVNSLIISHGFHKQHSAFLVSLLGLCNTVGRVGASAIGHWQRANRPLLYALVTLIFSLSCFAMTYDQSFVVLAVALGMFGMCFGAMLAQLPGVLMDLFGVERLVNALGYSMTAVGIGGITVPYLAGILADAFGLKEAYYLAGCCGVIAAGSCFANVWLKNRDSRSGKQVP